MDDDDDETEGDETVDFVEEVVVIGWMVVGEVRVSCGRVDAVVVDDDYRRGANARGCEGGPGGRVVRRGGSAVTN
ncbi:uncharacterized protein BXIN_1818 [Babesia sp. Xinjiang]|uniref:uncharacterized protein n=1 Tax=Babesia sp. Xinjiang TaxID=462227 RepID=UPI000A254D0C|nr:uncharacterized protein BXIN_1818 [Babesia sp. Xinjiang]ORM39887.1 hypothetical protein BXIN_1818 [Babesia sp. Xinjiang]